MKIETKERYKKSEIHKLRISMSMMGKRNSFKNARSINKKGYIIIYVNGKQKAEHRHIVENSIGRKLLSTEIVHHINHIKHDNRLENLMIVSHQENIRLYHDLARKLLKQHIASLNKTSN